MDKTIYLSLENSGNDDTAETGHDCRSSGSLGWTSHAIPRPSRPACVRVYDHNASDVAYTRPRL